MKRMQNSREETESKPGLKSQKIEREIEARKKEEEFIAAFNGKHDTLSMEEVEELAALSGPKSFEGELSVSDIDALRLFKDFTVNDTGGYEGSYQDAAVTFKEMGRMDGFDAMFSYRFS